MEKLPRQLPYKKMAQLLLHYSKIISMPVLNIILLLIVAGVLLWLINTYIPMDRKFKSLLNTVVVVIVVIWLLQAFGVWNSLKSLRA